MSKGDNVTRQYYGRRSDGVDLYRYAVPNIRTSPKPMGEAIAEDEEKYWQQPEYKVLQHPTEQAYDVAVDVDGAPYTYTETDIPTESQDSTETELQQKAEAYDIIVGGEQNEPD